MKKLGKISFYLVFGLSALITGYLLGFWTNFYYLSYKFNPVRISNKQIAEDVQGGKTPEETYNLFVLALKQDNIELASKYFIVGRQDENLEKFREIKEKNELQKYTDDLPKWEEMREINVFEDGKFREFGRDVWREKYFFEFQGKKFESPAGFYTQSISFRINTKNNIWKIESL